MPSSAVAGALFGALFALAPPGGSRSEALLHDLTTPARPRHPPLSAYDLSAALEPGTQTVAGEGKVRWTNGGSHPVRSLCWHLYLNAFRNDRSIFMRESGGGELRGDRFDGESWGYVEVTRLLAHPPGGGAPVDLLPGRVHPESHPEDRTVMNTPLSFSVQPGEQVELEMSWVSKLPRVFSRSGYEGSFYMVAQWFPKLGVLEETHRPERALGEDGGPAWNCHPHHAHSEYFADFADYRVEITVPEGFVVGATGPRRETRRDAPGRVTHVHVQDRVHDFAFTADPRFLELRRTFSPAVHVSDEERAEAAAFLGLPPELLTLSEVEVILLVQPEHRGFAERYFRAVFEGLKWFGLWYGAYPYSVLTVVDGPRGAGGAMGMEYPTLFAGGSRWPAWASEAIPEGVAMHELGHQLWYGLVATNEFEHPWLDEGLTTYTTGKVLDRAYPPFVYAPRVSGVPLTPWLLGHRLRQEELHRLAVLASPDRDSVDQPAWAFRDGRSYGVSTYHRPALVLRQLERQIGEAAVARGLRLFAHRWRYRHPTPEDLFEAMEEVAGAPLRPFFEQTLRRPGGVDYAVTELTSRRRRPAAGYFEAEDAAPGAPGLRLVTREEAAEEGEAAWETTVYVERRGEAPAPVVLEVRFDDEVTTRRAWDGDGRWARFELESAARARSAELHPDGELILDLDRTNDSRRVRPDPRAGVTWGAHALYVVQTAWQLLGGIL